MLSLCVSGCPGQGFHRGKHAGVGVLTTPTSTGSVVGMSHLTVTRDEYDMLVALNHDGRWSLTRPASAVARPEVYGDDVVVLDYDQEVAREVGYMRTYPHGLQRGERCRVVLSLDDPRMAEPVLTTRGSSDTAAEFAGQLHPRVKISAIKRYSSGDFLKALEALR